MKQLFTFFTCLLLLSAFAPAHAQSKVAHINTQQLLSEMPEVIAANKELEKLEKQYATQLETSAKEFDTKVKSYSADAENQTDLINQQRQTELQDLQQRIAEFRQTAAQELQKIGDRSIPLTPAPPARSKGMSSHVASESPQLPRWICIVYAGKGDGQ